MQNRVREARRALNMTQEALAQAAGVTRQTISLIEKGDYNPSLLLCLEICRALDKTLDQLFWLPKGENGWTKDRK